MSIGKNAIKRVENNGYSHVETHAPDMENSVVEPAAKPEKNTGKRRKAPQTDGSFRVSIGEEMPVWLL